MLLNVSSPVCIRSFLWNLSNNTHWERLWWAFCPYFFVSETVSNDYSSARCCLMHKACCVCLPASRAGSIKFTALCSELLSRMKDFIYKTNSTRLWLTLAFPQEIALILNSISPWEQYHFHSVDKYLSNIGLEEKETESVTESSGNWSKCFAQPQPWHRCFFQMTASLLFCNASACSDSPYENHAQPSKSVSAWMHRDAESWSAHE